jgi:hypothetical protein
MMKMLTMMVFHDSNAHDVANDVEIVIFLELPTNERV